MVHVEQTRDELLATLDELRALVASGKADFGAIEFLPARVGTPGADFRVRAVSRDLSPQKVVDTVGEPDTPFAG